ncbi:MAG: amidohydrolase family protein [Halanaerobiales bacterium]|nr:amidohydrolase family protein [Halanaerobiales bacterium]
MEEKKFYDIHCHAFNLSHPNLLAFIRRFNIPVALLIILYFILGPILPFILFKKFGGFKMIKRVENLLSVMENDIGSIFLLMEDGLKRGEEPVLKDGKFKIDGNEYTKIVLTPLMMDYGYKNMKKADIYYGDPPQKPIVEQVFDMFNGIKRYYEEQQFNGIFEIYPFLGLNTQNYTLEKIEKMLDKYFSDYCGSNFDCKRNLGKFDGNIENIRSNFFTGVKVYPPLGFDPWPEENLEELKKVECLYKFCSEKRIPITTHCSKDGFIVIDKKEARKYTSPIRWEKVLKRFPDLKINLAHFGSEEDWTSKLIELVLSYEHVYVDFSYRAYNDSYYKLMKEIIEKILGEKDHARLKNHILFGSDFLVNLIRVESYTEYLEVFSKTNYFSSEEKNKFCSTNPERFLFGG